MSPRSRVRRTTVGALTTALVAGALWGVPSATAYAAPTTTPATTTATTTTVTTTADTAAEAAYPPATKGATVDWFDGAYPALDPGSVFETVTVERFEYLLKKDTGRWAFVIGGPEDEFLQDTIGQIQAVAAAEGIERIYNFDPRLDGKALSVFDLTGFDLASADNAGKDQFLDLGQRLVTDYLSKDDETPFALATDSSRPDQRVADGYPYLFVYDAAGGTDARIVDALTVPPADLSTPEAVTAYRADVRRVLTSASLDVDTQWDFLSSEHNRRHYERYVKNASPAVEAGNLVRYGGDIFDAAVDLTDGDEEDFRIENVTYPELINILDSDGDFVILFGGTWCHNTAAIIKQTAQLAREHGITRVYNFDFSLDSTGNGGSLDKHIRDNAFRTVGGTPLQTRPSYLYGNILERLSNASTQYRVTADEAGTQAVTPVRYYADGVVPDPANPATGEKLARKIQVGHLLSYRKGRLVDGRPAPVLDQAIRSDWTNPEGAAPTYAGNVEYMTEWWFTLGKDDVFDAADPDRLRGSTNVTLPAGQSSLQNQRNFARETIRAVHDVIAGVAGGYGTSLTTTGLPTSVPTGEETPLDVTATVASAYDGFFSDRTAGSQSAPLTGRVPLGGTVRLLVDGTQVATGTLGADRTVTLTGTVPALPAGAHQVRTVYSGGNDGLVRPVEADGVLDVVAETSSISLDTPPALTHGTAGQLTARLTPGATGVVTLTGLPAGPVTGTLSGSTATFAVPATTPAGTYAATASYDGDTTYAASTSTPVEVVVGKALTIVRASSRTVTYGKGGSLVVSVVSPAGVVVSGPVTLSGVGATQTRNLGSAGTATFPLPKALRVGRYSARLGYAGTGDLRSSLSQVTYTVAKGTTGRPTIRAFGTLRATTAGRATVTVPTSAGLARATGRVTVTLTRGGVIKKAAGTLRSGTVQVALPRLTPGTWRAVATYAGDGTYLTARSAATGLAVRR